jgi:hypothetical protein
VALNTTTITTLPLCIPAMPTHSSSNVNEIFFGKSSVIKILAFLLWFLTLHINLKMICSRGPAVIKKKQNAWTDVGTT